MQVKLCNTPSERNIINKYIDEVATVNAVIKGELSVETPVLILDYTGDSNNINYMVIPELHRTYFINDIIKLTGQRYEIHGKSDVLESFKNDILAMNCIINKQQGATQSNMYLDDGSFVLENKEFNTVINFPNGFNDNGEYILITAGGGGGII